MFVLGTITLLIGSTGVSRANATGTCAASGSSLDGEEQALITLTNNYRTQHGLVALSVSSTLQQAATWMAADMTTKSGFGHTDSLGRPFYVRQVDCGYSVPGGENIGAGGARVSAVQAFDLFFNSAEHNAIMLSPEFRDIGVA
ncbi:MAG: CAP domain-containing protein, partial [Tepidiformaceae bacterium]